MTIEERTGQRAGRLVIDDGFGKRLAGDVDVVGRFIVLGGYIERGTEFFYEAGLEE